MKKLLPTYPRILAIAPSTRGFGFALLQGLDTLVDWGVKSVKGEKNLQANRKRLLYRKKKSLFCWESQSGAKVCRYERYVREPSLETALAFEAIYKRSVSELFSGLYQKVEREVAERGKLLNSREHPNKSNAQSVQKREAVAALMAN